MKRRQFIALIGGAAVAWPRAGQAQQAGKLPTIGFLGASSQSGWSSWTGAFVTRLRELGWIEGHTVAIEYRWAEGRKERFAEFAAEFVRLKVDVIVTAASAGYAAKQVTSTIPIVLAVATDPVGDGLVMSLARPGGNVTGMSLQQNDIAGKRLGLLREILPSLKRVAILADAGFPADALEMDQVEAMAHSIGIEITRLALRGSDDIAPAIEALKGGADALYVCADSLTTTNQLLIITSVQAARLPTIFGARENVGVGGLMSYGPSFSDLFRNAAEYVDKILRGAKPSDLPIEQPTKFELVINLKTAKALGLTIPPGVLAIADEVIE
jgi:putative tryptophan/tyrosine transport system substrate-binding protein